jgi:hypothetical protein
MKRYQLRDGDQIPTRLTTAAEIGIRMFALGVADVRAGRGFRPEYETWQNTNDRWAYERGRQWARLGPRSAHHSQSLPRIDVSVALTPLDLR